MISCLGSDPRVESHNERSRAMCTDGIDNDGDGHYDCYDPDCRVVQDSLWAIDITDTICHYEKLGIWIAPLSSSAKVSSSSQGISSSESVSSSSVQNFPFAIKANVKSDSIQVFALKYNAERQEIAIAGRYGKQALFGIIDTSTTEVLSFNPVSSPDISGAMGTGAAAGRVFTDIDTNTAGIFTAIGNSDYTSKTIAMTYTYDYISETHSYQNSYSPHNELIFSGYNTPTTECLITNNADTGFVLVDINIDDNLMATYSNYLPKTKMAKGTISGTNCVGVGTRTASDSSQVWLLITSSDNIATTTAQVSTGSDNEKAFDIEVIDDIAFIATKIDNQVQLILYDIKNDSLISKSKAQGPGTPHRLRTVKVNGKDHLLMVGAEAGKGALWLFSTTGNLVLKESLRNTEAVTISDALQLPNGVIIAGGWRQNSDGGTEGVLHKLNTSLKIIP
ncbi:MAG: hypothetical protein GX801_08615 [Fibrobacter sp.]|nr:hypothetical protein [Fibrobacter sp.]